MIFYALASPINTNENEKIHNIWNDLDFSCDMKQVKFAPIPHFSYMTFEKILDAKTLNQKLHKFSANFGAFQIQVSGLGIFQGKTPILYLPIVKTQHLFDMHSALINEISECIDATSDFYLEENWIPHITLAIRDINVNNISCAIDQCMKFDLSFHLTIDHIAILYMDEESFGIDSSFPLKTSQIPMEDTDEFLGSHPS